MPKTQGKYRFSFGPWNIEDGADPFGPTVRKPVAMGQKFKIAKKLGFHGIQFHDDDVVADIDDKPWSQVEKEAKRVRKVLESEGLVAEFVAPRLWFSPKTIDGAYTNNDPACRKYAIERTKKCIDLNRIMGTSHMVVWLAREGTTIRQAKDPVGQVHLIKDALNAFLEHDKEIVILIEPKPNEPVDAAIVPTIGHAIAMGYMTVDPSRMGCLVETAHSVLAGLDASDDMGFGLAHGKLRSVHFNDQGGLKFDQDKSFGSYNLRAAFDQVRVLERHAFGTRGEWVGFDVKAMRTQKQAVNTKHLSNSLQMFKDLLQKVVTFDTKAEAKLIKERDYEELDRLILSHLMGVKR